MFERQQQSDLLLILGQKVEAANATQEFQLVVHNRSQKKAEQVDYAFGISQIAPSNILS
jgi:hypothetical protein